MKQKVIKIGSSIGVVLSRPVAEELGFKAGQEVDLHIEPTTKSIIIEHAGQKAEPNIAEVLKMLAWTAKAIERYRPALEALKDKWKLRKLK